MRQLNVGCGQFPEPGWLNIDRHGEDGMPDARPRDGAPVLDADLFDLDPGEGRYGRIYCGHSLEHIDLRRLGDAAHKLAALLAPDGTLCVVGPDLIHAGDAVRRGEADWTAWDAIVGVAQLETVRHEHPYTYDPGYVYRVDAEPGGTCSGSWPMRSGWAHWWRPTAEPIEVALTMAGLVVQRARPEDLPDVWPVVCRTDPTQFALLAEHA